MFHQLNPASPHPFLFHKFGLHNDPRPDQSCAAASIREHASLVRGASHSTSQVCLCEAPNSIMNVREAPNSIMNVREAPNSIMNVREAPNSIMNVREAPNSPS